MNKLELTEERLAEMDVSALSADGFDDAIIGIAQEKVVYSRTKCIEILVKRDNMDYFEATEFFDFNVEGAYMGEKTPIWVDDEFLNN